MNQQLIEAIARAIDADANGKGDWLGRSWTKSFAEVALQTIEAHGYRLVPAKRYVDAVEQLQKIRSQVVNDKDDAVCAAWDSVPKWYD